MASTLQYNSELNDTYSKYNGRIFIFKYKHAHFLAIKLLTHYNFNKTKENIKTHDMSSFYSHIKREDFKHITSISPANMFDM